MHSQAILILALLMFAAAGYGAEAGSVWSGVYSEAQAEQGKDIYLEQCVRCHSGTLLGGEEGTPLVGEYYRRRGGRPRNSRGACGAGCAVIRRALRRFYRCTRVV